MRSDSKLIPWIVCQIGAREHYSIARALKRLGVPVTLVTDYWSVAQFRWFATRRMRQRYCDDLGIADVQAFNSKSVCNEILGRLRTADPWVRIMYRNKWFGKLASKEVRRQAMLSERKPVVFSYSYAALEIFSEAKKIGARTVLGQIDPGPAEARIVDELHKRANLPLLNSPPREYWERWRSECELAEIILVNSEWSKGRLIDEGIHENKLRVVPLVYESTDSPDLKRRQTPETFVSGRPLRVLFLGQVIARKGVIELHEAIRQLANEAVSWTVVGHGDERLQKMLAEEGNVHVVGAVSRSEAASHYAGNDVFVLPTHSDGYAITQLEAAHHGLAIIASRNCGAVVRDGVNGIVLDSVTGTSIADAVSKYLKTPGLCREHAANCSAERLGSLNDLADDLLELWGESSQASESHYEREGFPESA